MKLLGVKIVARVALSILALGGSTEFILLGNTGTAYAADSNQGHIYQIVGGSWYLHPSSPTIHSPTSDLMATGTEFAIYCWQVGDNVNGDSVWDWGTDFATGNLGFVTDEGTNTPVTMGNEPAQLTALGIPECGSNPITIVFFSPNSTPTGVSDLAYNTAFNNSSLAAIPSDEWISAASSCSGANVGQYVPSTANTLVGWSESRLAPIYFLAANHDRWGQIHTIVLFDPGDTNDFTNGSCDGAYKINSLLAQWLQSNPQNQLLVFTGERSETDGFHGLWTYYFADIWNQSFANQAIVCDYRGMGHPDVLDNFASYVGELSSTTTCPSSPDNTQYPLTQWNP